jgi:hypothetical protein
MLSSELSGHVLITIIYKISVSNVYNPHSACPGIDSINNLHIILPIIVTQFARGKYIYSGCCCDSAHAHTRTHAHAHACMRALAYRMAVTDQVMNEPETENTCTTLATYAYSAYIGQDIVPYHKIQFTCFIILVTPFL